MNKNNHNKLRLELVKSRSLLVLLFLLVFKSSYSTGNHSIINNSENYITETIVHEGVQRTYHIQFPENFDANNRAPLVLALHGGGGNGKLFEKQTSAGTLTVAANKRGMVIVFPEGIKKRWNSGRTEIFRGDKMYDDVGFISVIIDRMIDNYGIDAKRIYATGISNGGFMSIRLALELSHKIAAIAPVTAQISKINENKRPEFPVATMIVNGTKDPLVPYHGGEIRIFKFGRSKGNILSTDETIDRFKDYNNCNKPAEVVVLPNNFPNDGTEVEITKFSQCNENTEVILVKIKGGGHTWPSGAQYLPSKKVGVVSKEINASEMILDFFLKHKRKQPTSTNNDSTKGKNGLLLNQAITVNGKKRDYHIYTSKNPKNRPLVILLHGNRGNFNELVGKSLVKSPQKVWLELARAHNFIVAVPNGALGSNKKRGWNDCRSDAQGNPQTNDVLFISKLLDKLRLNYDYNINKVYVAGISNGGQMAMRLAMEIPEKITAFAAIVAAMPVHSKCNKTKVPVSALYMNGTADPILPFSGGQMASKRGLVKSANESISYWIERNGTSSKPIKTTYLDYNRKDKSTVETYQYKNGFDNAEVVFYKIINGGHTEPSKKIKHRKFYKSIVGNQNNDIEMAAEIWKFFSNKSK